MTKTKAISTSFYKAYKYTTLALLSFLFLTYMILSFVGSGASWIKVVFSLFYAFFIVKYWFPGLLSSLKSMKDISYDDEHLYITEDGVEEQIPFYDIKDVEIISLNGIYKFNFFNKQLHEGAVTCKTSMWYPLNFKKVDNELNRVRALIRKAHAEYKPQIGQDKRLASYN